MSASSLELTPSLRSSSSSKKIGSSISSGTKSKPLIQRKAQNQTAGLLSGAINGPLSSDIRQRVLSARQNRYRNLQSQLHVAQQQNVELTNENRLLKTLHKRQDNALAKYEGSSGELPQLINSHSEEIRVWQTKCRTALLQNRELNVKVQQKDKLLNEMNDKLKYLKCLTAEKNLEERETLTIKLESLEHKMNERDEEIRVLTRKLAIEAKNYKMQLANERKKYKELCQKLNPYKQNGSSNDSDYSSGKDGKEAKYNNPMALSPSMIISEENQSTNIPTDDDDDLVIKPIVEKEKCKGKHCKNNQIADQLADIHLFTRDQSINAIQQNMKKDIEQKEALLDLHCDELTREIDDFDLSKVLDDKEPIHPTSNSLKAKSDLVKSDRPAKDTLQPINSDRTKPPVNTSSLPRFNINLGAKPSKRTPIDSQRKNKLLAQLKSIDSANSSL